PSPHHHSASPLSHPDALPLSSAHLPSTATGRPPATARAPAAPHRPAWPPANHRAPIEPATRPRPERPSAHPRTRARRGTPSDRMARRGRTPGYPDGVCSRSRVHPDIRIARGYLLAATSAVLSITAHAVANGALPPLSPALVIAGLTGWISTALVGRAHGTRSGGLVGILITLAGSQLLTHFTLTWLSHPAAATSEVSTWGMVATHACATVAMAALITSAERGLLAVIAGLCRVLPVVLLAGPPRAEVARTPVDPVVPATYTEVLLRRV